LSIAGEDPEGATVRRYDYLCSIGFCFAPVFH
jgi:hypothetical protein